MEGNVFKFYHGYCSTYFWKKRKFVVSEEKFKPNCSFVRGLGMKVLYAVVFWGVRILVKACTNINTSNM